MSIIRGKIQVGQIFGIIVIIALMIETILLIKQNRELKMQLEGFIAADMASLKPGERVSSINIKTLDGTISQLLYDNSSRKYLLFVFSTTCPHCDKTFPSWLHIVNSVLSDSVNIVGLSMHNHDETKKFIEANNVGFYVASVVDDTSFSREYKISGVPETLLLNSHGMVEKVWIGELTDRQADEIISLVGSK